MTIDSDQAQMVSAAMMAAGDLVYEWNLSDDSVVWIGSTAAIFGSADIEPYSRGEAFHGRINPEDLPFRLKSLSDHYLQQKTFDCEYRIRRADGEMIWVHDRGFAEFTDNGQPLLLRGILRNVDLRKQNEARLEHLANFDELTGHLNRGRLRDMLHQEMAHCQRYDATGALLCIGIDKMSLVNDAYGYLTADAVIVGAGQRLERMTRDCDAIGRLGGDVYGLLLSRCPETDVPKVAEKILRLFRDKPIQTPVGPIHVSVSIGGVVFPSFVQTPAEALTRAESVMQEAKRQGRDCFRQYKLTEKQRSDHRRDMEIGEQVKDAVKNDNLLLAYQPVVEASSHQVAFYECLLRMRDDDGRIIAAGEFVPVVERLGLARMMDRRVLELGIAELDANPDVRLALNISGFTASDHGWLRRLVALVGGRRELAERLIVEITETAAIQDIEETALFVANVRDIGCQVALDDFGAGYTSFRHLKALTVDVVKIDGSFVRDIAVNNDNRLFVRTLVGLARGFGLRTVAECVETPEAAKVLVSEGADYLQGYHFARPELVRPWQTGETVVAEALAETVQERPMPAQKARLAGNR
ncbi:MAG: GGDEF and EAL domain-containing protein [Alphaproteobacteria bacterium]